VEIVLQSIFKSVVLQLSYSACSLAVVTVWAEPLLIWDDVILHINYPEEHPDLGKRFLSTLTV
jgi:hypothetical protein